MRSRQPVGSACQAPPGSAGLLGRRRCQHRSHRDASQKNSGASRGSWNDAPSAHVGARVRRARVSTIEARTREGRGCHARSGRACASDGATARARCRTMGVGSHRCFALMLARAADGHVFRPSRHGRGRIAAATHGVRARARAMARRRGRGAGPCVAGHTGALHPCWRGRPTGKCFVTGALSPPKKCATERFATDPATAKAGCDRRGLWCHWAALRVYLRLRVASQVVRSIGWDQLEMYALRHRTSSVRRTSDARFEGQRSFPTTLNQASSRARRALMQQNAEVRPARTGERFCLESGSEKEAAARRTYRRRSPRKGMYCRTSSGRLAGCHAGHTWPHESAAEASTTYVAGEHLLRAQQSANPCGGRPRQRRTNFPPI